MTGVLHTAKISTVDVILSSDNRIKMVNFELTPHEDFGSADPSSMQDTCHI